MGFSYSCHSDCSGGILFDHHIDTVIPEKDRFVAEDIEMTRL